MRRRIVIPVIFASAFLIFFGSWEALYPSDSDPKGLGYQLWKAGVFKMNLKTATELMVADPKRDQLIVGKSEPELEKRFGALLEPSELGPNQPEDYYKRCYLSSRWKDLKVRFIRNSPWMVVFDGEKARETVLIKGC